MLEPNDRRDIQIMIDRAIAKSMEFSTKKRGDNPTDGQHLTPQKYVNMNGSVAARPIASVAFVGQTYFATDTNIPMTFTTNKNWVNGVGSVVAIR